MDIKNIIETDVCVIGAGAAGLSAALKIPSDNKITVVSGFRMGMSSSAMAQGGIAAAVSESDSVELHAKDSINAGCTLADKKVISSFAKEAITELKWLEDQGVVFNRKADGSFCLRKESGHSAQRIVHVNDETGKAIMTVLQKSINANTNISMLYEFMAVDFVVEDEKVVAVQLLDTLKAEFVLVKAKCFILASGGASGLFSRHTSPNRVIGSGIAMAWRAGCSVANMEFQNFYPICFNHAKVPSLLISDALHWNGAHLMYENGHKFSSAYDKSGEFLDRDVVSRVLFQYKKATCQNVYIDVADKQKRWVKNICPSFYRTCLSYCFDITKEKVPIFPAAHFTCGGVVVDENCLTKFKNLYAIGEVANHGVSGADRLCANSLMECMVFAKKAAVHISENIHKFSLSNNSIKVSFEKGSGPAFYDYTSYSHNIQALMWEGVGIMRSNSGLLHTKKELLEIKHKLEKVSVTPDSYHKMVELRNMVLVALIMTHAALLRKESRGSHYNEDYPSVSKNYDGVVSSLNASFVDFSAKLKCEADSCM